MRNAFILFVLLKSLVYAEFRIFEDNTGREVIAQFVDYKENIVSLKNKSGSIYKVPFEKLSSSCQEFCIVAKKSLSEQLSTLTSKSNFGVKFYSKRRKALVKDQGSGNDDFVQTFDPSVIFKNKDLYNPFTGNKATVILLGESVKNKKVYKILLKETFDFKVDARSEFVWEGDPVTVKYDENASNGYIFGHKYTGYILIIKNKRSEVVFSRSTRKSWIDSIDQILNTKVDKEWSNT